MSSRDDASNGNAQKTDTVVQNCDTTAIDAVITDKLTVIDPEKTGARAYLPKERRLDIVQTAATDTVKIRYTGPKVPPTLKVYRDSAFIEEIPGGGSWDYDVTYHASTPPYESINRAFSVIFTKGAPVTNYRFDGIPGGSVYVNVYNPDQWKLKIELPPARKYEVGAKLDNQSQVTTNKYELAAQQRGNSGSVTARSETSTTKTVAYSTESSGWGKETTSEDITRTYETYASSMRGVAWKDGKYVAVAADEVGASASTSTVTTTAGDKSALDRALDLPVKLERNMLPVKSDLMEIVGTAIVVIGALAQVVKLIKKLQDTLSVGWYCKFDCQVAQGVIEFSWGWREHTDHRVYHYFGIGVEFTIVSVSIEIGVGAVIAGVGVQICVVFTGDVKVKVGPKEWGKPDEPTPPDTGFKLCDVEGTVEGALEARAKAGRVANAKAGAKVGIKITAEIMAQSNWSPEALMKAEFPSVVAYAKLEVMGWSESSEVKLTESKTLFDQVRFPGRKVENTDELTSEKSVEDLFYSHLNSGMWPIKFHTTYTQNIRGGTRQAERSVARRDIAKYCAKKIWAKRHMLDMEVEVVDGLACSFRKECERLGVRNWERDSVSLDRLKIYIHGGFKQAIRDAYAPDKVYELMIINASRA